MEAREERQLLKRQKPLSRPDLLMRTQHRWTKCPAESIFSTFRPTNLAPHVPEAYTLTGYAKFRDWHAQMFHCTFISFIALRVIFCPLLCIGCDDVVHAFWTAETCTCSATDREPCHSSEATAPLDCPADCPCPCDAGCVCQVTPEVNNRTVGIDFFLTVDFLPACFDTLDFSRAFASRGKGLSHRPDLESGRDVRIAHASFLL